MSRTMAATTVLLGMGLMLGGCTAYDAAANTLPHAYLAEAQQAAQAHDAAATLAALDRAEYGWHGANTPYGNPVYNTDPDVPREIGRAREAVQMQRWADADYYIGVALTRPSTLTPN